MFDDLTWYIYWWMFFGYAILYQILPMCTDALIPEIPIHLFISHFAPFTTPHITELLP